MKSLYVCICDLDCVHCATQLQLAVFPSSVYASRHHAQRLGHLFPYTEHSDLGVLFFFTANSYLYSAAFPRCVLLGMVMEIGL